MLPLLGGRKKPWPFLFLAAIATQPLLSLGFSTRPLLSLGCFYMATSLPWLFLHGHFSPLVFLHGHFSPLVFLHGHDHTATSLPWFFYMATSLPRFFYTATSLPWFFYMATSLPWLFLHGHDNTATSLPCLFLHGHFSGFEPMDQQVTSSIPCHVVNIKHKPQRMPATSLYHIICQHQLILTKTANRRKTPSVPYHLQASANSDPNC